MRTDGSPRGAWLSRRAVLAGATSAAGALAGCGETLYRPGDGAEDDALTLLQARPPAATNCNPLGRVQFPWSLADLLWDPLVVSVSGKRGYRDVLLADHAVADAGTAGTTATLRLREDHRWWNGDPVTARDVVVPHRVEMLAAEEGEAPYESVAVTDDHTVAVTFADAKNHETALGTVAGWVVATHRPEWADAIEALADATTADERQARYAEAIQRRVRLSTVADRGLGHGPYRPETVSQSELVFERVTDHPGADHREVPRVRFVVTEDASVQIAMGALDAEARPFPADMSDGAPASFQTLAHYPADAARGLRLNHQNPHLARAGVRRALLALVSVPTVHRRARWGNALPFADQTGLSPPVLDAHLDDADRDALYDYPVAADPELAARFMRQAGYERDADGWVGPAGERPAFDVLARQSPGPGALDVVADALREFGVGVSVVVPETRDFASLVEERAFDVRVTTFDGGGLGSAYGDYFALPESEGNSHRERDRLGRRLTGTIPAWEDLTRAVESGETPGESVRVPEHFEDSYATAGSWADLSALAGEMARWWNVALPDLVLAWEPAGVWGDVTEYDWPASGDPVYRTGPNPIHAALRRGVVVPGDGSGSTRQNE